MKILIGLALVAVFMFSGTAVLFGDDHYIRVFQERPEEGTYTEIGELRLPQNEIGDDASIAKLTEQAMEMGANGIVMFDKPVAGESLIMTDNRLVTVGVAIKYE